jgi:hypothetical protein
MRGASPSWPVYHDQFSPEQDAVDVVIPVDVSPDYEG